MFYNDGLRQMPYDGDIDINITNQNVNANMNDNNMMMGGFGGGMSMGTTGCPVVETPRERCVQRNIFHEVPQD